MSFIVSFFFEVPPHNTDGSSVGTSACYLAYYGGGGGSGSSISSRNGSSVGNSLIKFNDKNDENNETDN